MAEAVKQVKPEAAALHPTAPSTYIMEKIASFVADGQLDTEFLNMESEHSAMSSCIGASAAGGRVFTAASSQGLASMHEVLFIASSLRLPIVAAVVNRALSAPINGFVDHADAMAERDCGWIQIFSENPQAAYDNMIQAFKIAEHMEVRTPVMVGLDGFVTSHSLENVFIEELEEVIEFVGKFKAVNSLLDTDRPVTMGSGNGTDYYFEHKVHQLQGIKNSRKIIREVGKEFGDRFGRYYGFFESYKLEDADFALVLMGSAAGTAKELVDELRGAGEKAGLLRLRVFRPFPYQELREALSPLKSIAVLDRVLAPGSSAGPLFNDICSALYDLDRRPLIFPYIYGLGGRDITMKHFGEVLSGLKESYEAAAEGRAEVKFINLRA